MGTDLFIIVECKRGGLWMPIWKGYINRCYILYGLLVGARDRESALPIKKMSQEEISQQDANANREERYDLVASCYDLEEMIADFCNIGPRYEIFEDWAAQMYQRYSGDDSFARETELGDNIIEDVLCHQLEFVKLNEMISYNAQMLEKFKPSVEYSYFVDFLKSKRDLTPEQEKRVLMYVR
jgi:hypothetical protein